MPRTITVKGVGAVSAKPDLIVITMTLENTDMDYETSVDISAKQIQELCSALVKIGFEQTDLKTTSFNVSTSYNNEKDRYGNYKRVFDGYECTHRLKLEFDLDISLLGKVLAAIASCSANPELSIGFTVKEPSAVSAELLKSATVNAKAKAEILCEASGVKLGSLLTIDYNWGELNVYSNTRYEMEEKCMAIPCGGIADMNFEPDDIDVSDTVTFVWEIA